MEFSEDSRNLKRWKPKLASTKSNIEENNNSDTNYKSQYTHSCIYMRGSVSTLCYVPKSIL